MTLPDEYYAAKTNIDNLLKDIETASFQLEADKQAALKDALSKFMEQFVTPSWNRSTIGRNPVIYAGSKLPSVEYTLKATYSGAQIILTDPATQVEHALPYVKQFEWEHPELIDYNFVLDNIFKTTWLESSVEIGGVPPDDYKDGRNFYFPTKALQYAEPLEYQSKEDPLIAMPLDDKTLYPFYVYDRPLYLEWEQFLTDVYLMAWMNANVMTTYGANPAYASPDLTHYTEQIEHPMLFILTYVPGVCSVQILGQCLPTRPYTYLYGYAAILSPTQVGSFNYVGQWETAS